MFPLRLTSLVAAGPATLLLTTAGIGGSDVAVRTEVATPRTRREGDGGMVP